MRTVARITLMAAAVAGLSMPAMVQGLGLGEISVNSSLNQRFSATIPLSDINAEDLETLTVSLASPELFERAGVEPVDYLQSLSFTVKRDGGRARVIVSSPELAREPVLNLLIQARWSGGRILRDYMVLLDPAETAPLRPLPAPAPAAAFCSSSSSMSSAKACAMRRSRSLAAAPSPSSSASNAVSSRRIASI